MKTVYLDNNATTMPAPEVVEAMLPFFREYWGNPSSMHTFGGRVKKNIEQARASVASLIGADPSEIVFTGCGTESDNTAIHGAVEAAGGRAVIVTTRVEHPAVLGPCRAMQEAGHKVIQLGVDSLGRLDLQELKKALQEKPTVVSVMWANNETGVVFPIAEIAAIVKEAGCLLHTDAVQAAGKLPIDVRRVPVDMLSLSGHKLHAPKGIGALYIRRGTKTKPFMLGGHQEGGRRAGTENVPYIVGIGHACELSAAALASGEMKRIAALRDKLQAGILASCSNARVNGDQAHRLPNTLNVSLEFIEGEAILLHMNDLGICASSGSACTSGSLEPSHVIHAMGVPFTAAHGSTRFSLSRYTTEAEIDYVIEQVPQVVKRLLEISPFA